MADPIRCEPYSDYVVCEDGRTYVAPEAVGRYLALPRSRGPERESRKAAPADVNAFRNAYRAFEREAKADCRARHQFEPNRRDLCERQEIGAKVQATGDPAFIDWWAAGGAR